MIIHKANYSYLHVAIRQKAKFLIYVNHIYKFMVSVYYGFGISGLYTLKRKRGYMFLGLQSFPKKQLFWNIFLICIIATASTYIYFAEQENPYCYSLAVVLCIIRFFTCPYLGEKNLLKIILNVYLFIFGISLAWEAPVSTFDGVLFFYLSILIPILDLFRMKKTQKNKTLALALCFFLGWCGGHKFYLRKDSAWAYLIFFWTGIPALLAIWDFIVILLFDTDHLATNQTDRLDKVLEENSFEISKVIEIKDNILILFDDKKNKIMFFYDNPYTTPQSKIIHYNDIIDFELCTDGNSRLQGHGIASFAGAVITDTLGLSATAGAVIGSVSGDRKVLQSATSIIVNLQINDLQNPLISVVFLDREVDKEGSAYKKALSGAQNFIATLAYAKNKIQKTNK